MVSHGKLIKQRQKTVRRAQCSRHGLRQTHRQTVADRKHNGEQYLYKSLIYLKAAKQLTEDRHIILTSVGLIFPENDFGLFETGGCFFAANDFGLFETAGCFFTENDFGLFETAEHFRTENSADKKHADDHKADRTVTGTQNRTE